jgi:hypothetical protein
MKNLVLYLICLNLEHLDHIGLVYLEHYVIKKKLLIYIIMTVMVKVPKEILKNS